MAQPSVEVRPLDEPRDVRHLDALPIEAEMHRAELRAERGEGVGRNLGRGARDGGEQRGLARVGQPHEADIRHELE